MIPYLCLWGIVGLIRISLGRHICMDAFTSGWNKNIHPWILAGMGHKEAKTGGRSEQREKIVRGVEIQSKRRRVGDSVQRNSCCYCWRNKPSWRICKVSVLNAEKDTVYSSLVDFYSKYPEKAIRIITPKMPKANYTLQVEITGVRPVWTDKTKQSMEVMALSSR